MLFPSIPPWAAARIAGDGQNPALTGTVEFYPMGKGTLTVVQLLGLPEQGDGFFALHIHEGGACTGSDFSDAGGHYNPDGKNHPAHAGDLPPLIRCRGGRAYLAFVTDRFSIEDLIGRTVVVHSGPDDFHTQPTGNAGKRIGCGEIRRN